MLTLLSVAALALAANWVAGDPFRLVWGAMIAVPVIALLSIKGGWMDLAVFAAPAAILVLAWFKLPARWRERLGGN